MPFNPTIQPIKDAPISTGLNILIYGPGGVGKTTLAATAGESQYGSKVLLVDIDTGVRSIATAPNVDHLNPFEDMAAQKQSDMFNYFKDLCGWLHSRTDDAVDDYRTVVLDTVSELQDQLMGDHLRRSRKDGKPPEWPDYNHIKNQMVYITRQLRLLAAKRGVNVVLTAHDTGDDPNGPNAHKTRPALSGATRRGVLASLDLVGWLSLDAKTGKRKLLLEARNNTDTKKREPADWPNPLPGEIEDPSLVSILQNIHEGQ